ncbi:GNAT family N-acetyltransferase [Streptomyces yunnanensis]|uniref:GNAT family N-acetyltransferase n=1 Tax=Streptomyces yunnanensis TaxID=156453 RepID=A0ABY8AK26_9ACTN|nr:GNAT family N-acetyltransferase [Streptomyces yunnanensis]WEB45228.1 GNAT family N-acetyltransferase [Streptomyces yunnanensis]
MNWHERAATVLDDGVVRLRPITTTDREGIRSVAMDPAIWRYFVALVTDEASFETFFDTMIADHAAGRRVVFHITDLTTGRTAGSMSYGNLSEADRRLEIGWSWLGRDFRGAGINRHAKLLLLHNAFERLGAERVEFKTDQRNEQARRALRNIGATEEGILRSFNPMPDGTRRDAVYYSVLRGEWPSVRERLTARVAAR